MSPPNLAITFGIASDTGTAAPPSRRNVGHLPPPGHLPPVPSPNPIVTPIILTLDWRCNCCGVGLATQNVAGSIPSRSTARSHSGKLFLHTCPFVTKRHSLVPIKRWCCPAAGKVTVGLRRTGCIRHFSGLSKAQGREMSLHCSRGMAHLA